MIKRGAADLTSRSLQKADTVRRKRCVHLQRGRRPFWPI